MTTYFGATTPGAADAGITTQNWLQLSQNTAKTTFTCPGSGAFNVTELSLYCTFTSGVPVHLRLAVYDLSNNLMAQGNSAVVVTSGYGWQGHIGAGAITQTSPLTGGVNYKLAWTVDYTASSVFDIKIDTGVSGDWKYDVASDTAGFPATITNPATASGTLKSVRCGVDPQGSVLAASILELA